MQLGAAVTHAENPLSPQGLMVAELLCSWQELQELSSSGSPLKCAPSKIRSLISRDTKCKTSESSVKTDTLFACYLYYSERLNVRKCKILQLFCLAEHTWVFLWRMTSPNFSMEFREAEMLLLFNDKQPLGMAVLKEIPLESYLKKNCFHVLF